MSLPAIDPSTYSNIIGFSATVMLVILSIKLLTNLFQLNMGNQLNKNKRRTDKHNSAVANLKNSRAAKTMDTPEHPTANNEQGKDAHGSALPNKSA